MGTEVGESAVFDANLRLVETSMHCRDGEFELPSGPGLGVEPGPAFWKHVAGSQRSRA